MAKDLSAKCKQCRRAGEKLFLKGERCHTTKCAMVKKNYPPGMHGQKGYQRITEYGTQLREKQKAKKTYGILEKQFKNYYIKASKKSENTADVMLQLLEMRLDNVVYRAGFASSRRSARQQVNHGHFLVNDKKVNIPSYQVKVGDKISVTKKSLANKKFQEILKIIEKRELISWLKVNKKELSCEMTAPPDKVSVRPNFAIHQIIEFYSR